jgi:3-oxoacyl-(acyl-carrier-protein) synthase
MTHNRRVVVTGMGTINPLGHSVSEFWKQLIASKSGIKRICDFPVPDEISQIAGIVQNFKIDARYQNLDRSTQFALSAATQALQDANLPSHFIHSKNCAVYMATAISQISSMEKYYRDITKQSKKIPLDSFQEKVLYNPFQFNSTVAFLANILEFKGGYATVATGCTGGLDAIGLAMTMIRKGRADVVLTGASEAPITPLVVAAFSKIGATSKQNKFPEKASRPFELKRDGFVLAEGAGLLVLESLDTAIKRGARIYAELKGFGSVNNCYHMTNIPEDGLSIANACQEAIKDAKITTEKIDFINSHGSSTIQNDVAETNAYYKLFGSRAADIPANSIKSQIGHALSAANAIEVISSILSIKYSVIPPTINYDEPDPKCKLNIVGNQAKSQQVKHVLKTSSGFSGIHSSLIIGVF